MIPRPRHLAPITAVTVTAALLSAAPASAASPDLVISQVYGGGGNSGATWTNDYIELFNRGAAPVDLSGWSVQYASAAGTSWASTALSGSVAPGARYLVQEAAGSGGSTALPNPDAAGNIAMSGSSGKVRLVAPAGVRDLVGYGSASEYEGTGPAPTLSNTTAALRAGGGATDTDDNAADFSSGAPAPRAGGTTPPPDPGQAAEIHEIQGANHRSPLTGKLVTTTGVVTAVGGGGFWIQDTTPDADPATSEGVYVFTSSKPTVAVADDVSVTASVAEYRSGGSATSLTTTELSKPKVTVVAHGAALPGATLIGPGGRVAPQPVRADEPGDVEQAPFDVAANALDFYESMEGMLVRVVDSVASGPTNSYGELSVLPGGVGSPRTVRGGVRYTYADANAERVILDDVLATVPVANTGDSLPGAVDGVLDYGFGNYKFEVTATPTVVSGGIAAEVTRAQTNNELAVATYNVENLDPGDPVEKFDRLARGLVTNLASPDIVAVEEMQDNNGPTNDGTVAADVTFGLLIDAIKRAGGPVYDWRSVTPQNLTDGGEPGGNIRVGFLFRTDRDLTFVDRGNADATAATTVISEGGNHKAGLSLSPGRIDPTNPAFEDSRKPLAGEFRFRGRTFFVVANHFNSKGGDQPLFGRFQPPTRSSEVQRHAQATVVRSFVDQILAMDPSANVVLCGDLNDFEFSQTADILVGDGSIVDLPRTLPENQRYTYVYDGNSQVLDHILLSQPAAQLGYDYDVVHVNAEFADQASDHDPQIVRVRVRPGA